MMMKMIYLQQSRKKK